MEIPHDRPAPPGDAYISGEHVSIWMIFVVFCMDNGVYVRVVGIDLLHCCKESLKLWYEKDFFHIFVCRKKTTVNNMILLSPSENHFT